MQKLKKIYQTLYSHYDNLPWWPADTPFEVMRVRFSHRTRLGSMWRKQSSGLTEI